MKKETMNNDNDNLVLCKDLISEQFNEYLQKAFDVLGKAVFTKRVSQNVTKAYYVMCDLKSGIPINQISQNRLNIFHSVTLIYVLNNKNDELIYSCGVFVMPY